MKHPVCDRESELRRSMRAGALDCDLRTHLASCAACRQTERVASMVMAYAGGVAAAAEPPSPARIWRRAQQRRQEAALRRVSAAMLAMRALGAIYVCGVVVWALHLLWKTQPERVRLTMVALTSGAVPLGLGAAMVLLVAGASSLVLLGQRRQTSLPG